MRPMLVTALATLVINLSVPRADAYKFAQLSTPDACALFTLEEAGKASRAPARTK